MVQTAPSLGWLCTCITFLFLCSPPRGRGLHLISFLSFMPEYVNIFLTALVVRSPFVSFQLVFRENCSTCRCIFDVFMGGSIQHLYLNSCPLCFLTLLLLRAFPQSIIYIWLLSQALLLGAQVRMYLHRMCNVGVFVCVCMYMHVCVSVRV